MLVGEWLLNVLSMDFGVKGLCQDRLTQVTASQSPGTSAGKANQTSPGK